MSFIFESLDPVLRYTYILIPIAVFLGIGTYTDATRHKLYRSVSFAFMGLRLIFAVFYYPIETTHVMAAIGMFLVLTIPGLIFRMKVGGDVFFLTALGFWMGLWGMIFTLAITVLIYIPYCFIRSSEGGFTLDKFTKLRVPFGPFCSAGCVITILLYYLAKGCL